MELEEVSVAWLQNQETEVAVGVDRRLKWRSTKCKNEKQDAEREYVGDLGLAWHVGGLVHFGGHVYWCAHLHVYEVVHRLGEAEIAKFERTIICNKNIFKFDIHMSKACLLMEALDAIDELFAN